MGFLPNPAAVQLTLERPLRTLKKMEERPFSVAVLFSFVWIALAYLGNFVVLPVWNNLNTGLCLLGLFVCISVYFTEYLAIFPISYR